jgi:hypothetical protein
MKVTELLTEKKHSGAYYNAGYDAEKKAVVGAVKDWVERIGASPEDLAAAYLEAKKLPSYKALTKIAPDISNAREAKNGTFSFKHPSKAAHSEAPKYNVRASGQIRGSDAGSYYSPGTRPTHRLASPKPRLVAGNPVKSLVLVYDGAFKELVLKAQKVIARDTVK